MRHLVLIVAIVMELVPVLTAQATPPDHPKVSLVLPEGINPEMVEINYYMVGPFGSNGLWRRLGKSQTTYEIDASVEGQAARRMKVIAWLPGCEIITLEIAIEHAREERKLTCKAVSSVDLKAQIFPTTTASARPAEVEVQYFPEWSPGFFGIYDGPIFPFQIGKTVLEADGTFEIKLPDLASQSPMNEGAFDFILHERGSGNVIFSLQPMDEATETHRLKVLHQYPPVVRFAAERRY